jgi:2-methylcitrate dehydratase PrpD
MVNENPAEIKNGLGEMTEYVEKTTKDLARFIEETNYEDLPETVSQQAKLCFLDFLSVSLRGSGTESAQIIRNIIGENGKNSKSTVIGGDKSIPLDAALANGVSAHSLDLDDGHRLAQIHPAACIIPAALALSEASGKTGKDFITSIVVGYQVAIHLGMILNPEHRNKGFHGTGTCGTLGAAAAAAKIIDLNMEEILNALGLAGTQAAGLLESDHTGSMGKHLHAGKAAQSGVLSVLLASEGFTGADTILEGKEGLFKAMSSLETLENNNIWKHNLERYEILRVYFKKYPVCRHLHSSLEATINILKNNSLNSADIQEIIVETYAIAASHDNYHPQNMEGIRQSLPLSIAIAIHEGNLTVNNISRTIDNEITTTADKVRIKLDNNLNNLYPQKRPSKVTIKCKDNIYTQRVDLAKGEPENPLRKDELLNKFRNLNPQVDVNCLKIIDDLEDENITEVMDFLNNEFKM